MIKLNKVLIGAHLKVSENFLENLTMSVGTPDMSFLDDTVVIAFRSFLWGEDLGEVIISHPANWWEAVKDRWYPRWYLKRYPVKLTTYRAKQSVVYPELTIPSLPEDRKIYQLTIIDDYRTTGKDSN